MKLSYYGYFTPFGGYGIVNLNWVTNLLKLGVKVYPHRKFEIEPGSPEWDALSDAEKEIFSLPFEKQKIGIIETTPFDLHLIETPIKIANTMCEADFISKEWVDPLNAMDWIIVPNQWNADVFQNSGVARPITVIPHGQDTEMFTFKKRKRKDIFTFGTVGYLNDRKGVFDLIQAFHSEFKKDEPVRLLLKSSNKAFGFYNNFTDKRIKTDVRHLPMKELVDVYHSIDCFVFPTKAEGVGNPPREALLTGCPVIATNYSGIEEISAHIYPLSPIGFDQRVDMIEQPGKWAKIDIQELMYQMRYVYENYEEASDFAEIGSAWMAQEFNWPKVTGDLIKFVKSVSG